MSQLLRQLRRYERRRRVWRRVDVGGRGDCWPWTGDVDATGEPVHRDRPAAEVVYALVRGPLPPGAHLERRCPDRLCVNPEHMTVVPPGQRA
jgi:hypothetical protein